MNGCPRPRPFCEGRPAEPQTTSVRVKHPFELTMNRQDGTEQRGRRPALIGDDDDMELDDADPEELLDKADVSIKNLNHSLM